MIFIDLVCDWPFERAISSHQLQPAHDRGIGLLQFGSMVLDMVWTEVLTCRQKNERQKELSFESRNGGP